MRTYQTDVAVIGAGLAGIVTALELLDQKTPATLIDGSPGKQLGGQANDAFGDMLLINTQEQARNKIHDSPELLYADWCNAAEFSPHDIWPKHWARLYAEHNRTMIYDWLQSQGIRFFPSVQWVERGLFGNGNSMPRYHIAWGCGRGVVQTLAQLLENHPNRNLLTLLPGHRVESLVTEAGAVTGCAGNSENGEVSRCSRAAYQPEEHGRNTHGYPVPGIGRKR